MRSRPAASIASAADSSGTYAAGQSPTSDGTKFVPVANLALAGGTLTGAVNFGGVSGHAAVDANGDLRVRSGQQFAIYSSSASTTPILRLSDSYPTFPQGLFADGDIIAQGPGGIRGGNSRPTMLRNTEGKPILLGDTATSLVGYVIDLALPTFARDKIESSVSLRTGRYTVATLPTPGTVGRVAYATNGRKSGEAAGAGTGVPAWDDGAAWRTFDGSTVSA